MSRKASLVFDMDFEFFFLLIIYLTRKGGLKVHSFEDDARFNDQYRVVTGMKNF